jgi:hypothetical protein
MQTITQEQILLQIDTKDGPLKLKEQHYHKPEGFILVTTERFVFIHIEKNKAFRPDTTIDEMLQTRKENYAIPNNQITKIEIIMLGPTLIVNTQNEKVLSPFCLTLDKTGCTSLGNQLKQIYGEKVTIHKPKGLLAKIFFG